MGVDDFVVLDRGNDLGGTWRDNSYPGASCDVPSNLYSFSFALNPTGHAGFSSQSEIWDYMRRCVDRFDVGGSLHFNRPVSEARWDDDGGALGRAHGRGRGVHGPGPRLGHRVTERAVHPDFPGLGTSAARSSIRPAGSTVSTWPASGSAWWGPGPRRCSSCRRSPLSSSTSFSTSGRRRSSCPAATGPSRARSSPTARRPALQRLSRLRIYAMFEALLSVFVGHAERRKAAVRKAALDHLAKQVPDEALRQKLCRTMSRVASACSPTTTTLRSPGPTSRWWSHRWRPSPRTRWWARTIARPVDVVIMGTGFEAAEPPYAEHIVGRDGVRLSEIGRPNGVEAYAGSTVTGFPNLFLMIGPNSTLAHNSMIYMIESHINYIASALAFLPRPGCAPWKSSRRCSGATTSACRRGWPTRSGSRAGAAAGISTTVAATRRCGRTTPGSSPAHPALSSGRVHRPRVGPQRQRAQRGGEEGEHADLGEHGVSPAWS